MAFLRRKKKSVESPREGEKDEYPGLPPVWRGQTWGPLGQMLCKVIGPPSPLVGAVTTASPVVVQRIVSLVDVNPKAPLKGTGEIAWVLAAAWQERTGALDRSTTLECKQRQQMEKLEKVEEVVPGWEQSYCKEIALCLHNGGGRPEPWEGPPEAGGPAELLAVLEKIAVQAKAPVAGLQRRMRACATAWKKQYEACCRCKTQQLKDKQALADAAAAELLHKQHLQLLNNQLEQMTRVAEGAVAQVSVLTSERIRIKRSLPFTLICMI